ncbi:MAG: DUF4304 domain-containing protein [Flavobacteriaceae bacterium]|nr:DUF4304 domain-containing protein [Flavobacteriaceae bacterium]
MIKEKFKEIIKTGIHPFLKEYGFKKKGNHFTKKLEETQQVVTLQLSHGNSDDHLRFYFRCGILINGLKNEIRDLKSEVYADYRFGLNSISENYKNDYFEITNTSSIELISKDISQSIKEDLIPFFNNHQTEEKCIEFMINRDSLESHIDIIKYLCLKNRINDLEKYSIRLTNFLKTNKHRYSDKDRARKSVDRIINIIKEEGKMNTELNKLIEKNWLKE